MVINKTNPVGVDKPIQKLQNFLFSQLKIKWGLTDDQWMCYGRCYKNQGETGYIPEVYIGNNEYREVFYDDNFTVISFFGDDSEIDFKDAYNTNVFLVFSLDISKIKSGISHRADAEIHMDVADILSQKRFGFEFQSIETGIDNVYREFGLYKQHTGQKSNTEGIVYRDMHPLHCFRVNLKLRFQNINC